MVRTIRIIAIVLLIILTILAIGGGWMLIIDPTGKSIHIPIDLLIGSPFNDYLMPGIILFVLVGLFSFVIAILTVLKKKGYAVLIILEGLILVGWLSIELAINKDFYSPILHIPLYVIGFILILAGLRLRRGTITG